MRRLAPPGDKSFLLEVPEEQATYCPQCFRDIPLGRLRSHLAQACKEREVSSSLALLLDHERLTWSQVTCKEPGCGAIMPKSEMKRHLLRDCLSVKRRDRMALNALNRPAPPLPETEPVSTEMLATQRTKTVDPIRRPVEQVTCEDCGESVVRGRPWVEHRESGCRMRLIYCPHRAYGCDAVVPLCKVSDHLKKECEVEKRREFMVQNSKLRRELVVCTGCGASLPLFELRQHEEDLCSNRYVPCRNAHLGCAAMVRLKDRAQHEQVDGMATRRSVLYLGPGGSHLFVNEDDMVPPWTVEYWIFRPSRIESAKNSIRGVQRRRMHFRLQFLEERSIHQRILQLREEMKELAALSGIVDNDGVHINIFKKEALIERLSELASKYEDAVVISERLARLLQISLSAAIAVLEAEVASNSSKVIESLEPEPPGDILSELLNKERLESSEQRNSDSEVEREGNPDHESADDFRSDSAGLPAADNNSFGLCNDPVIDESLMNATVFEWLQRMIEVKANLSKELLTLKGWRDDASLQTQRANVLERRGVKEVSSKMKSKKQLKEERREKERQRREERRRAIRSAEGEDVITPENAAEEKQTRVETKKKLYEKLADELRVLIGAEILQESNTSNCRICIDVDAGGEARDVEGSGRVGFVTMDGAFAFNASVPRQKWTHVSIVCTSHPKKRTMCYINGKVIGKLSESFALPMTTVGSTEQDHSFIGCILDVRIWSVARSASEVRDTMHKLLNPRIQVRQSASRAASRKENSRKIHRDETNSQTKNIVENSTSAEGIVAWWTFEDARCRTGWSSRVTDVSDQRFRVPIISNTRYNPKFQNFLWLDPSTLRSHLRNVAVTMIPLPSYRDRNICKFELKRFKLAQKGRALMAEGLCSNGCGEAVRLIDMRFHCKYECMNRVVKCPVPYCNEEYRAKDQWLHENQDCAAVKVRRRLLEQGAYLNELNICTLCSESVKLRDLKTHEEEECEYRLIKCIHNDCEDMFAAHMLQNHLKYSCKSSRILKRQFLVRRARQRVNYARPWGIDLQTDM